MGCGISKTPFDGSAGNTMPAGVIVAAVVPRSAATSALSRKVQDEGPQIKRLSHDSASLTDGDGSACVLAPRTNHKPIPPNHVTTDGKFSRSITAVARVRAGAENSAPKTTADEGKPRKVSAVGDSKVDRRPNFPQARAKVTAASSTERETSGSSGSAAGVRDSSCVTNTSGSSGSAEGVRDSSCVTSTQPASEGRGVAAAASSRSRTADTRSTRAHKACTPTAEATSPRLTETHSTRKKRILTSEASSSRPTDTPSARERRAVNAAGSSSSRLADTQTPSSSRSATAKSSCPSFKDSRSRRVENSEKTGSGSSSSSSSRDTSTTLVCRERKATAGSSSSGDKDIVSVRSISSASLSARKERETAPSDSGAKKSGAAPRTRARAAGKAETIAIKAGVTRVLEKDGGVAVERDSASSMDGSESLGNWNETKMEEVSSASSDSDERKQNGCDPASSAASSAQTKSCLAAEKSHGSVQHSQSRSPAVKPADHSRSTHSPDGSEIATGSEWEPQADAGSTVGDQKLAACKKISATFKASDADPLAAGDVGLDADDVGQKWLKEIHTQIPYNNQFVLATREIEEDQVDDWFIKPWVEIRGDTFEPSATVVRVACAAVTSSSEAYLAYWEQQAEIRNRRAKDEPASCTTPLCTDDPSIREETTAISSSQGLETDDLTYSHTDPEQSSTTTSSENASSAVVNSNNSAIVRAKRNCHYVTTVSVTTTETYPPSSDCNENKLVIEVENSHPKHDAPIGRSDSWTMMHSLAFTETGQLAIRAELRRPAGTWHSICQSAVDEYCMTYEQSDRVVDARSTGYETDTEIVSSYQQSYSPTRNRKVNAVSEMPRMKRYVEVTRTEEIQSNLGSGAPSKFAVSQYSYEAGSPLHQHAVSSDEKSSSEIIRVYFPTDSHAAKDMEKDKLSTSLLTADSQARKVQQLPSDASLAGRSRDETPASNVAGTPRSPTVKLPVSPSASQAQSNDFRSAADRSNDQQQFSDAHPLRALEKELGASYAVAETAVPTQRSETYSAVQPLEALSAFEGGHVQIADFSRSNTPLLSQDPSTYHHLPSQRERPGSALHSALLPMEVDRPVSREQVYSVRESRHVTVRTSVVTESHSETSHESQHVHGAHLPPQDITYSRETEMVSVARTDFGHYRPAEHAQEEAREGTEESSGYLRTLVDNGIEAAAAALAAAEQEAAAASEQAAAAKRAADERLLTMFATSAPYCYDPFTRTELDILLDHETFDVDDDDGGVHHGAKELTRLSTVVTAHDMAANPEVISYVTGLRRREGFIKQTLPLSALPSDVPIYEAVVRWELPQELDPFDDGATYSSASQATVADATLANDPLRDADDSGDGRASPVANYAVEADELMVPLARESPTAEQRWSPIAECAESEVTESRLEAHYTAVFRDDESFGREEPSHSARASPTPSPTRGAPSSDHHFDNSDALCSAGATTNAIGELSTASGRATPCEPSSAAANAAAPSPSITAGDDYSERVALPLEDQYAVDADDLVMPRETETAGVDARSAEEAHISVNIRSDDSEAAAEAAPLSSYYHYEGYTCTKFSYTITVEDTSLPSWTWDRYDCVETTDLEETDWSAWMAQRENEVRLGGREDKSQLRETHSPSAAEPQRVGSDEAPAASEAPLAAGGENERADVSFAAASTGAPAPSASERRTPEKVSPAPLQFAVDGLSRVLSKLRSWDVENDPAAQIPTLSTTRVYDWSHLPKAQELTCDVKEELRSIWLKVAAKLTLDGTGQLADDEARSQMSFASRCEDSLRRLQDSYPCVKQLFSESADDAATLKKSKSRSPRSQCVRYSFAKGTVAEQAVQEVTVSRPQVRDQAI